MLRSGKWVDGSLMLLKSTFACSVQSFGCPSRSLFLLRSVIYHVFSCSSFSRLCFCFVGSRLTQWESVCQATCGVISPQNTSVTLSIEMLTRNFNLIVVMTVGLEGLKLLTSYYKTRLHL